MKAAIPTAVLSLLGAAAMYAQAAGAGGARIVFSKSFPGSVPPFVLITLQRDGKAVYQESADDEQPIKFSLRKEEADQVFQLGEKLDKFSRQLESGLPVARMGDKILRWEEGAVKNEVKFNYSQDADARAVQDWFERISETAQHYIAVERAVKFDKLGVNKALLQMHAAMDRNRLVGLDTFLPLLDRVVKNDSYLHMARERAATLAEAIRHPPAPPAAPPAKPEQAQQP